MYQYRNSVARGLLYALLLAAGVSPVLGADTVTGTTSGTTEGQSRVQTRYVGEFGAFAGSDENAQSLYSGLRSGSSITLASPSSGSGGAGTGGVQIDPPTRPMGNGNVFISTALARQQLANHGITDPTPQELQAALTGGTIKPAGPDAAPVELKGILVQRADGMGWGSIAKASGMNLGQIISGMRSSKPATLSSGSGTTAGGGSVTTAAGTDAAVRPRNGSTTATNASAGHGRSALAPSRGIVTAAGGPVTANGVRAHGGGRSAGVGAGASVSTSAGAGIATLSGVAGPGRSGLHAQGQGKGLAKH